MESGSHSRGNHNVRLYTKMLAALLCFILVLFSFLFIDANSQAAASKQKPGLTATMKPTTINTGTATSTPTPTPTATNTPTPTPTATNTPAPTPTATRPPRRTPTATATMVVGTTPTATASEIKATATAATATPSSSGSSSTGQTPTGVPGGTATTTTSITNDSGNGTTPAAQPRGGSGIAFFPFIAGALVFLGIVSAFLIGFLLLRKRLLLPQPVPMNLPPSGAQPWRRVRSGSVHDHTNIVAAAPQDGEPTLLLPAPALTGSRQDQRSLAAERTQPDLPTYANTAFLAPRTSFVPNIGARSPADRVQEDPAVAADISGPTTDELKAVTRRGTRLVKLDEKR